MSDDRAAGIWSLSALHGLGACPLLLVHRMARADGRRVFIEAWRPEERGAITVFGYEVFANGDFCHLMMLLADDEARRVGVFAGTGVRK